MSETMVALLVTRRRDGRSGFEFRVARVAASATITDNIDYPPLEPAFSREVVRALFAGAQLFRSEIAARNFARRLQERRGIVLELKVFDYSKVFFPASDGKRARRRRWEESRNRRSESQQQTLGNEGE
jgi:hypothetical protein